MEYNSFGLMIKKINSIYERKTNNELSDLQLTRTQLEVLIYLDIQNEKKIEVNQVNIEEEFNLKNPTVTGILNRLEEKEFIKRTVSDKNARFKKITITENAKKLLEQGRKIGRITEKQVTECLSKDEKEQLEILLMKVFNAISKGEDEK